MSSFVEAPGVPILPLLLAPLLGGVARSGGSKYDNSSIGSTTLSGNSCNENILLFNNLYLLNTINRV